MTRLLINIVNCHVLKILTVKHINYVSRYYMVKKRIDITSLSGQQLLERDTSQLEIIVYNNFIHLKNFPNLKHTPTEIHRLFNSNSSFYVSASINGKLVGYVLGEYIQLSTLNPSDNRLVCYVSYIYVVDKYRKHGVASNMFNYLIKLHKNSQINGFMLTFDTENNKLKHFYEKRGFMQDIMFRNYSKYDVYYRSKI